MSGELHLSRPSAGVVLMELDNAPMNAMNRTMLLAADRALDEAQADDSVRAVVLTGRGPAFCSGADLKEVAAAGQRDDDGTSLFNAVLEKLASCRAPVVAAINGHCIGGGFELALCCDIRLASTTARFVCAGVNVGLMASAYRLPRAIGVGPAKAMLLTGLPHDAQIAERWGLVTGVHEPDSLVAAALGLADRIATRAPLSVEASKRVADQALQLSLDEVAAVLAIEMPRLLNSRDHREGVLAFAEKRTPVFTRS